MLRKTILLIALFLSIHSLAFSATYWLATDGSDSNPGTVDAPVASFNKAVSLLTRGGDELVIRPGRYICRPISGMPERDSWDEQVVIRAEKSGTVELVTPQSGNILAVRSCTVVRGLRFSGLYGITQYDYLNTPLHHVLIEQCWFGCIAPYRTARGVFLIGDTDYITIRDCQFDHCLSTPLVLGRPNDEDKWATNILIERCVFAENGRTGNNEGVCIEGVREGPTNGYIRDQNIILRDCVSWGHGDAGYDVKTVATFDRCIAYDNNWGFKVWGEGTRLLNCLAHNNWETGFALIAAKQEAWNCTSAANGKYAFRVYKQSHTNKLRNCIILGIIKSIRSDSYYSQMPDIDYCCWWVPNPTDIAYEPKHEYWNLPFANLQSKTNPHPSVPNIVFPQPGEHMVYADPQLVDVDTFTGYPRPSSKSPARKAGLWMDCLVRDLSGCMRVLGIPPDLGALTSLASRSLMEAHSPDTYATQVPRSASIVITFVEPVVEESAQQQFALVANGDEIIRGAFEWPIPFRQMRFIPTRSLPAEALCRVRLARGILKQDGTVSLATENFSFTTSDEPVVELSRPSGKAVPVDKTVRITFDSTMDQASVESAFTIDPAVEGTFSWSCNELTFTPATPLSYGTTYTVTINNSARSAAGVKLKQEVTWSFRTATGPTPRVVAKTPDGIAVDVASRITITFSMPMHRRSVERCFSIEPRIAGDFVWNKNQLIFRPNGLLQANTCYNVTIGKHARSATGVELWEKTSWSFTTMLNQ